MSERLPTIPYESSATASRRSWGAARLPFSLLAIAITPLVFLWTNDLLANDILRDFGMKRPALMATAVDFLNWYGPGYGWIWGVLASAIVGVVLPKLIRWPRPNVDRRDLAIWCLATLCATLTIYLSLNWMTNTLGWQAFRMGTFGISSGGGRVAPATPGLP